MNWDTQNIQKTYELGNDDLPQIPNVGAGLCARPLSERKESRDRMTITKPGTVKKFLKTNSKQRISTEAIPAMLENINQLAIEAVKKAEALSKADDRTTILDRDIQQAFQSLGGVDASPEGLFQAIEKLSPEEVGQIALLIAEWSKEHRKGLGFFYN